MNITRFEPMGLFNILQRDIDRMAARRPDPVNVENTTSSAADWVPAVDIIEEDDRFVLLADVPGVQPEDIDVNIENGVLSVSGQRLQESISQAAGNKRLERRSGTFSRRFTLPKTANPDEVSATSQNGILEVVIPKRPEVKARRISVEAA